jgi:hypothetical protein
MVESHTNLPSLFPRFRQTGPGQVDKEQPRQRFRLKCGINDHVPGVEATVCNLVLIQKGEGHNVIKMVTELQNLIKETFPGQHDDCFADTEVDDVKKWYGMVGWPLDSANLRCCNN